MVWVPDLTLRPTSSAWPPACPGSSRPTRWWRCSTPSSPGWPCRRSCCSAPWWRAGWAPPGWCPALPMVGRLAVVTAYQWSPLVVERLLIGHWPVLIGWACLPWVLVLARRWRSTRLFPPMLPLVVVLGSLSASAGIVTAIALLAGALGTGRPALGRGRRAGAGGQRALARRRAAARRLGPLVRSRCRGLLAAGRGRRTRPGGGAVARRHLERRRGASLPHRSRRLADRCPRRGPRGARIPHVARGDGRRAPDGPWPGAGWSAWASPSSPGPRPRPSDGWPRTCPAPAWCATAPGCWCWPRRRWRRRWARAWSPSWPGSTPVPAVGSSARAWWCCRCCCSPTPGGAWAGGSRRCPTRTATRPCGPPSRPVRPGTCWCCHSPASAGRRWNGSRTVLDPVGRYQPRDYVSSDVLVVGGVPIEGEDPRVAEAETALGLPTPAERSGCARRAWASRSW